MKNKSFCFPSGVARSLDEACLGSEIAENTLFCHLSPSVTWNEMLQMLNGRIYRFQMLKLLFSGCCFFGDLIFSFFSQKPWLLSNDAFLQASVPCGGMLLISVYG